MGARYTVTESSEGASANTSSGTAERAVVAAHVPASPEASSSHVEHRERIPSA